MAEFRLSLILQFGYNALRQHFPEFNTPLVKGIDFPDDALSKDRMLIKRNQLAQRRRRQPVGEDRIRRPVALEDFMRRQSRRNSLGFDLPGSLTKSQGLR